LNIEYELLYLKRYWWHWKRKIFCYLSKRGIYVISPSSN